MATLTAYTSGAPRVRKWLPDLAPAKSLSGRLLLVTILCVLVVEALIFLPSSARYRAELLRERLNATQIAALAVQAAPGMKVTDELAAKLVDQAGVTAVFVNHDGTRELLLGSPMIPGPASVIDVRRASGPAWWLDTIGCLTAPKGRFIRVIDTPMGEGDLIEMVIPQHPLQQALRAYAWQMFVSSLTISILTGALVYFVLYRLVVRPMEKLSAHIQRFRDAPHDASAAIPHSRRQDEIGRAENALADMTAQVRAALKSNERLAALGGAVARIAHDLRNSLAAAQIVSERLADSDDPKVRQSAPRLERALERAVKLAENTLSYGRAEEPAPQIQFVALKAALEEAGADALAAYPSIRLDITAPADLIVRADRDNLHRIAVNLVRNAAQAMTGSGMPNGVIAIAAARENGAALITFTDEGPGVPERVKANLFAPFAASTRQGGSGLGLAIARELARAMGGDLFLQESDKGARFGLRLPAETQV